MSTKLFAPESYWTTPENEKKEICNGCGSKGSFSSKLIPNTLWGLNILEACQIHDYMYHIGENIDDKDSADRAFLNNMVRLINKNSVWFLKPVRRHAAMTYYTFVCDFGGPAFWANKNKPGEMQYPDKIDDSFVNKMISYKTIQFIELNVCKNINENTPSTRATVKRDLEMFLPEMFDFPVQVECSCKNNNPELAEDGYMVFDLLTANNIRVIYFYNIKDKKLTCEKNYKPI